MMKSKSIKYLIKCYCSDRKGRIVICLLFFFISFLNNYLDAQFLMEHAKMSSPNILNYISNNLSGIREISSESLEREIKIPSEFIILFGFSILLNVGFIRADLKLRGSQYFLRIKSQREWWLDKNIVIFVGTFIYYVLFFLPAFVVCLFKGELGLSLKSEMWIDETVLLENNAIVKSFVVSFFVLLAIVSIQILMELVFNEFIGLIVSSLYIFTGCFVKDKFLIINYTMILRKMNFQTGMILSISIWIACICIGYFYTKMIGGINREVNNSL